MPESPQQGELPLEAPPLPEDAPLLPARMVNEYVYCPRLAYLEWVQGEWKESADTVAGAYAHRRVDREDRPLPPAEELQEAGQPRTRSVALSSPRLGLIARIDLVESDGDTVVPVDYKRGKRPHVPAGAYEPERVQLCVQGLLLEENGYPCTEGVCTTPTAASGSGWSSTTNCGPPPGARSSACVWSPPAAASPRRCRTAPNARAARSSASACPTKSTTSSARVSPPARSPCATTRRCRSTFSPTTHASPRRARPLPSPKRTAPPRRRASSTSHRWC